MNETVGNEPEPLTYEMLMEVQKKISAMPKVKTFLLPPYLIERGVVEGVIEKIDGKMYFTTEGFRGIEIFEDMNLTDRIIMVKDGLV